MADESMRMILFALQAILHRLFLTKNSLAESRGQLSNLQWALNAVVTIGDPSLTEIAHPALRELAGEVSNGR